MYRDCAPHASPRKRTQGGLLESWEVVKESSILGMACGLLFWLAAVALGWLLW